MKNPGIDERGNKWWYNDKKQLHRIDGPAFEYANGSKYWHINHKLHRIDGPAVERADGSKQWWINDKDITDEALIWYQIQGLDIDIPLTNDEQILFKLKFA